MAQKKVAANGKGGNEKQVNPTLERMEALRNEFVGLAYSLRREVDPGGIYNMSTMAAGCCMDAVRGIYKNLLEQPAPPHPEPQKVQRGRKPKPAPDTSWAENIEGVVQ